MNQQIYVAQGYNGAIAVTPNTVILSGKGMQKEILISEITAINFSLPSFGRYGSLRFSFRGGMERGLYTLSNNTLLFKHKHTANVLQAKGLIEYYRSVYQQPYTPHLRPF